MKKLDAYLKEAKCSKELIDLIELIAAQAVPIRKAFLSHQSYTDTENISGERQAAMDKWADAHIIEVLGQSGFVRQLASEEQDEIVEYPGATGPFAVVMDPLDGSSLIQTNLAVGTIIGIFENGEVLQKGKNLSAALYMLYGPMTVLVVSVGKGVAVFALNEDEDYILMEDQVKMPEGAIYASGGLKKDWTASHGKFIEYVEHEGFKLRYSGSYVADFHQILKYGGFYCYPALLKKSEGKLRLLFEAIPIGFIARQAGGAISDGKHDLLDVMPTKIHQRTPIYVGSKGIIQKMEEMMK